MKKLLKIIMVIMLAIAAQGTGFAIDIDDIEDLTTTVTPSVLADRLVGAGNVTGSPSFAGAPVAAGTFINGLADGIGLDQGIILSTGDISFALGPNRDGRVGMDNFRPGDSSLNGFVSGGTLDASALEFDFIPPQSRVTFTFVFASDEYPEFVNSQFNDVFGLFVNNVNIAKVPGTTNPITINTLNGTATPSLYNDNSDLFLPRFMTQYDGFSTVLSVSAIVTPGIANRVKVVIADTADRAMDSAVFLGPAVFSTATFSISGTITNGGVPLSGVSVALSGDATANTTTNASGVYTFTGLSNGNYTVTPSQAGFAFAPVNRAVVINNADVTGQDFTAHPAIFSISGTITSNRGVPLSGVSVALTGAATANTTTNGSGVYTFTGLANGNYTVTPSQAGFTFSPVNRTETINNSNVNGRNFTGTAAAGTFSISGTITTSGGGVSLSGVSVALTGAATANTITNGSGVYTFTGLANGNYTVTPSQAGFTFAPVNRAVTINNANVTGQDFVGTAAATTFSISGTIAAPGTLRLPGAPIAGVPVTLSGSATGAVVTNALGVYTFPNLANGNYTVTPSQAGFTFAPVNRAVTINNANVTGQDFTRTVAAGTFSISGTITTSGGGLPLSGVSVALTGAATANTTTNASGVYTFTGLANGNYTVTPSLAGFTFAPVSSAVVINNANVTGQDFTGTAVAGTFSISGTIITNRGLPLSGVSVALTGAATANTTTNASGVYTFTGLANGNYTVTPSLAGFTFTPVSRAVTINNANMAGQNFTRN